MLLITVKRKRFILGEHIVAKFEGSSHEFLTIAGALVIRRKSDKVNVKVFAPGEWGSCQLTGWEL